MKPQLLTASLLAISVLFFANSVAGDTASNPQAKGNPAAWTYTQITDTNIAKAVEALPAIIQTAMAETGVPGMAVAVVRADKVLLARGFGVRSIGKPERVDADTVFQLASLSKPLGATVVSRAVSDGIVAWHDPVQKYLPWFRIGNPYVSKNVTIGDLYAHRSGLPDHAGDDLEDLGFDREQILRRLSLLPTGPFRDQYAYTNFGLTAAAEAVAKAYKTSWEQLSEILLYRPAGMNSTSSRYIDYLSAANRAVTHQRHFGSWLSGPPRNPDPESPAGGVSSTANDMARWLQLHLGDGTLDGIELIKKEVIQIMRQPHSINKASTDSIARPSLYGFGLGTLVDGTGHVRWSHSGAFQLGAATNIVFIPAADIALAVLTNGEPHGIPEAITAQFVDILETGAVQQNWLSMYDTLFEAFYINPSELADETRPSNKKPGKSFSNYTGTYSNDYFGLASITLVDDQLVMALGPIPYYFPLTHWSGNTFSYYPRGENALGITAIHFEPDTRTMTIENLDEHGLGMFNLETAVGN